MRKSIENTASVKVIEGYVKTFMPLMLAVFFVVCCWFKVYMQQSQTPNPKPQTPNP